MMCSKFFTMKTELLDIRNCDCMELMSEFPDGHFDLAIVDPPYFDGPQKLGFYGGRCSKTGVDRNGYEKLGVWAVPDERYFEELFRVSKEQIIWGYNYYAVMNAGPGRIIWDKCNSASTFSDCEVAYCSMIDSVRLYAYMWNGMMQGKLSDGRIQEGNKRLNEKRIHPTQKPVQLYKWLLERFAHRGGRLLDTHLGSGSIAIAAHYAGCHLTACEIDAAYFRKACDRIAGETRQMELM